MQNTYEVKKDKERKTPYSTEKADITEDTFPKLVAPQAAPRKHEIIYFNLLTFGYAHIATLYGVYLACTAAMWKTLIFQNIILMLAFMGITAGAHRLWSHRAYKAKMPLQIILMVCNSLAFQNTVIHWVRDHRMHHRYSDTDADPHNPTRGFFFSHIGWVLVKKHPEVKRRGTFIDMTGMLTVLTVPHMLTVY
ncbi:jg16756 [Pararge aegeria aegeria]|uniref:Jg16756 protein n=1 Tax=Pararge aegeria aegeria TaxID=348720 RepID=A0A8S4RA15_9NEOP|nr:jg16756 [Pararge aegeria aegeria]